MIMAIAAGVVLGLGGAVLGIHVFADHSGGKFWFYWIAPLLALGFAGDVPDVAGRRATT